MNAKTIFASLLLLLSIQTVRSQTSTLDICATAIIHEKMMDEDDSYRLESILADEALSEARASSALRSGDQGIYTIPLVVHVLHTGQALGTGPNISDEQIESAITAVNDDFRKVAGSFGDGDGVDTEIEFCLATQDPQGNATNGINRIDASIISGYANEGISIGDESGADEVAVKALSRWDRSDYYNIWIVNEINDNDGGSGVQGYAYYPTSNQTVDGAVILYNAFGTVGELKSYTDRNRTLTHELGHAFYLYHTFSSGSCEEDNCANEGDRICDTPPTTFNPNCSSPACNGQQQVENYMDYSNENCLNMFTQGQKDRMRDAILLYRSSLLQSEGCQANGLADGNGPACPGDFTEDGAVSVEDFLILNSAFGHDCSSCLQDLTGDGLVDVTDFLMFNSGFGSDCQD